MKFEPTYNYGDTDLTIDHNLICWKFGELIKNLITLSSNADRQAEIIGIGATCDEMALEFDTYLTMSYNSFLDHNFLTQDQVNKLIELDTFFIERSGDKSPDFWDDFTLEINPEWEIVRQKASNILELLGMQNLAIEFDREEEYEMTRNGKRITMQSTKIRLVYK
ncbi:hypothetical protein FBD94_18115 [Pedobacter hiemivivus]|uniref:Uncharacterized protein n=1 Tax=Pedobacter hiemivivus TaxID=2530454 RepID=A0A4U1G4C9_9SPHI|nr:hypothetical protein [Pedobacter hiemivivus]TKC58531.1 hypothetical protein FBD94_18115 [Pedobacter hiemivivus]